VRGALRETFFECTGCIPAFRDAAPVGVADIEAGRHREFDSQSEQACRWEEPRAGICTVGQARMIGAAVEGRAVGWEEEAEVNS
jgi:hypothetical protein